MQGCRQHADGIDVKRMAQFGLAHGIAQNGYLADQQVAVTICQTDRKEMAWTGGGVMDCVGHVHQDEPKVVNGRLSP